MRLLSILLAVAACAGVTACGDDEDPGSAIPGGGTIFEYSRSGGIAFSVFELKIDADGTGTVSTQTTGDDSQAGAFKLSDSEVSELREILEENPISSFPDPGDVVCADCFEYTYAYGGEEYTASDVSEPVEGLDELDAFLAELPLPEDQPNGG